MPKKNISSILFTLFVSFLFGTPIAFAALPHYHDDSYVRDNYTKKEVRIPMRDGVELFTIIYTPKEASEKNKYPILMQRTCYSVAPYGEGHYKPSLGPSPYLMHDKYIFVYQDVRGRYMSGGVFNHMPPYIAHKKSKKDIDEASDTYDAIDWLVKNVAFNNGRVGQWGISYPGYYTAAGAMCEHPALKASSPQAPIGDLFFDDFHHNGAFVEQYFLTFPVFGVQKTKPENKSWYSMVQPDNFDGFSFYKNMGALKNGGDKYYRNNFFWQDVVNHPNYDNYWKSRSLIPQFNQNVKTAVMVVGGWFDAEDLYGPLHIYQSIEKKNPKVYNTIVMGPFGHGIWSWERGHTLHNDIYFGDSIASFYQKNIERVFFNHFLKGASDGKTGLPEAYMFNTGKKEWQTFNAWPAKNVQKQLWYLSAGEKLTKQQDAVRKNFTFISDPNKPVPSSENRKDMLRFTPHNYMSEDQRFASARPDVLVFQSEVLTQDVTFAGSITAHLKVATTGTDADWIVKVIDVYPPREPNHPYLENPRTIMAGYEQLVRGDVMRGRFRKSFEQPEPFTPEKQEAVDVPLQDVFHTFKKGHRIMVQVQSTWFPLIDRNPQKYVDNIYKASDADFIRAVHIVSNESSIEVSVLP